MSYSQVVGEASEMPGTAGGFTMVCFSASDVPVGTKVYAEPRSHSDDLTFLAGDLWDDAIRCDFEAFKLRVAIALDSLRG